MSMEQAIRDFRKQFKFETAVEFRKQSEANPSYIGKILSALRGVFGGHDVKSE